MNREIWLYGVLFNVLCKVDEDNDLDVNNVIKKIKERLEYRIQKSDKKRDYCKYLYTSWEKKGFDINHQFDLKDYDGFPIDSLFSIAINYKLYTLTNLAQVLIKAGANVRAPSKVRKVQLVKIQPRQSLASRLEQTTMLRKVTSVVKLVEWTTQGTTKVKVLSPEILDVIEVDTLHIVEDSKKGNNRASYHSLYRDLRPYHVLRWSLRKLGRSFVFLLRYVGTSQQRRVLTEDIKEVGLIDSTQSVGKPHTRGSGQQYSDWFRNCYANTTEVGITCKEN